MACELCLNKAFLLFVFVKSWSQREGGKDKQKGGCMSESFGEDKGFGQNVQEIVACTWGLVWERWKHFQKFLVSYECIISLVFFGNITIEISASFPLLRTPDWDFLSFVNSTLCQDWTMKELGSLWLIHVFPKDRECLESPGSISGTVVPQRLAPRCTSHHGTLHVGCPGLNPTSTCLSIRLWANHFPSLRFLTCTQQTDYFKSFRVLKFCEVNG